MSEKSNQIIHDLLEELSSELEIHYGKKEYPKLEDTSVKIQKASWFLNNQGFPIGEATRKFLREAGLTGV